jgi:outer membrane protein assembly factor BamB
MARSRRSGHGISRFGGSPGGGPIPRPWIVGAVAVLSLAIAVAVGIGPAGPGPSAEPSGSAPAIGTSSPLAAGGAAGGASSAAPTPGSSNPGPTDPAGGTPTPVQAGPFAGDLMIADRQNGRILIVDLSGKIRWRFPVAGSLPAGTHFAADDAFLAPDGRTIVANEEDNQVIDRIDIASVRIVWRFGVVGRGPGELHTPDDAYPLPNGDVVVADIDNCRVIEISPAKHIVRQWGRTGVCVDHAPQTYGRPNGDTPLPDGGLLITEILGSRVVRLDAAGKVVFDIHVPTRYPSDAHLDAQGNVVVADYTSPGAIVRVDPHGRLLWRYAPTSGNGRLDHPSLAVPLADGSILLNDDFRQRVIIIDPTTKKIIWQYGHTDRNGRASGYLYTPDGVDLIPPSVAASL